MYYTNGDGVQEDEKQFFKKTSIRAIYKNGKNGTTLERKDAYSQSVGSNISCNSTFEASMSDSMEGRDFLVRATTSYNNGGKLTKTTVRLIPPEIGGTQGTPRSATIEIGAAGYK
jgi:hypothetical protein